MTEPAETCPYCSSPNSPQSRYCSHCGHLLEEAASLQPPEPEPLAEAIAAHNLISASQAGAPASTASALPLASSGKRFANLILDEIIFLFGFYAFIFVLNLAGFAAFLENQLVLFLFTLFLFYLYYFLFESLFQRTPAKLITGTRVVRQDGSIPSIFNIATRTFVRFIPFEPLSGSNLSWWHDQMSGTRVIDNRAARSVTPAQPGVPVPAVSRVVRQAETSIPVPEVPQVDGRVYSTEEKKKERRTGLSIALIIIGLVLVCTCIAIVGFSALFMQKNLASIPEQVLLPANTATPVPMIDGYRLFYGDGMSIQLPETFFGGDPATEMDSIVANIQQFGPGLQEAAAEMKRQQNSYEFMAFNSIMGKNYELICVMIARQPVPAGTTIETAMQAAARDLDWQSGDEYVVVTKETLLVNGHEAARVEYTSPSNSPGLYLHGILYIVRSGDTEWIVVYSAGTNSYLDYEPVFDQSIQTFTIDPSSDW